MENRSIRFGFKKGIFKRYETKACTISRLYTIFYFKYMLRYMSKLHL